MTRILILSKSQTWRTVMKDALEAEYLIFFVEEGEKTKQELSNTHYDVVFLDEEGDIKGVLELLEWIKNSLPIVQVIVMSRQEKAVHIVKAIKAGAFDFLSWPVSGVKIKRIVENAMENLSLKKEIAYLRHEQDIIYDFDRVVAASKPMRALINTLKKFAKTDSTILMTGETGTGKSFFSGTIHFNSHRRAKPFVKINCANIPENLLESELFGHEKGAFTGADKLRIGRFEQAQGGTLFLDEIGEMSLSLQAKLLRVLEEKAFERLGGNKSIYSDVRVIAATNKVLEQEVRTGAFREDLFYRINILSVDVPPLRNRREDIAPMAEWLLFKISRSLKKRIVGFSPDALKDLQAYDWPGNVRQLANIIERAAILEESERITHNSLPIFSIPEQAVSQNSRRDDAFLRHQEKDSIVQALDRSLWIQKDAARLLGVSPRVLNYKIKKHGITHDRWRRNTDPKS